MPPTSISRFAMPYVTVGIMVFDCNEIISGKLWVGSYVRPENIDALRNLEITSILNLQSDWDLANYSISLEKLLAACHLAEIELRRTPIPDFDRQAVAIALPYAVEELENALAPSSGRVYVHCTAGINRAPTLAAAYLIKAGGLTAQEAYDYVIARRNCSPYLDTLQEYETHLRRMRCV
jgi:protein-tyrosine phosphatase